MAMMMILSKIAYQYASNDPIWKENDICVDNVNESNNWVMVYSNPYIAPQYSDNSTETNNNPKKYWKYNVKHVELPENWKLEGCTCGRNMSPDSFALINELGEIVKVLQFFENGRITRTNIIDFI